MRHLELEILVSCCVGEILNISHAYRGGMHYLYKLDVNDYNNKHTPTRLSAAVRYIANCSRPLYCEDNRILYV